MATPNYGWVLPDVLGSEGTWGQIVNDAITDVDADLKAASDVADAALPKAGGAMSGRVDLQTATMAVSNRGALSGPQALDLATAQVFTFTVSGALALSFANAPAGAWVIGVILRITNPGTNITWPSVRWAGGVLPAFTVAGTDVVVLLSYDNGGTWDGMLVAKDVR